VWVLSKTFLNHGVPVTVSNLTNHEYWTLGFPRVEPIELVLSQVGVGRVSIHPDLVVMSASVPDWHAAVRIWNTDPRCRGFVEALIHTFSELFRNLPRKSSSNGTLVIG
jgi:hypothetical protein